MYNSICRVVGLPEIGNFRHKFLLSAWDATKIPKDVKNETFKETITYLKTSKSEGGDEIRSYLKKRESAANNIFLSYVKR